MRESLKAMQSAGAEPTLRGAWFRAAIAAAVLLGLGLRLSRVNRGLPDFLEEAIPLRSALEMWGWSGEADDLNPHMFQYPSLTIYLHYLLQKIAFGIGHLAGKYGSTADYLLDFVTNPSFAVRLSRGLGIVADGVAIGYAGILGRRFGRQTGITAAALVAVAPTLIVTSSSIFTDTVMMALSLVALDRLACCLERGDRRSLIHGAMWIGLASGAKYPAACLFVPLVWVVWWRARWSGWKELALAGAVASGFFLLTTPFAALDSKAFLTDVVGVGERLRAGHLGAVSGRGAVALFYLRGIADNIGWPGLICCLLSLGLIVRCRMGVLVWAAALGFGLPIFAARAEFDRYLVPVIPLAAILASAGAVWMWRRAGLVARGFSVGLASLLLLAPLVSGALRVSGNWPSTQALAREWFERHIGPRDLVVQEAYGAQVLGQARRSQLIESPLFSAAGRASRTRFLSRRWYHMVGIPLAVAGPVDVAVGDSVLPMAPHAIDLNEPVYDLRLFRGVDYVVTSSSVRGRFEADPSRFVAQNQFYRYLDHHADRVAEFETVPGREGPGIRIYHLGERARNILANERPLEAGWWSARLLKSRPAPVPHPLATDRTKGEDLLWASAAAGLYTRRYAPFIGQLITSHRALGRCDDVLALAPPHLIVVPEDTQALLADFRCAGELGRWWEARALAERLLPRLAQEGRIDPEIGFEYARMLAHTGEVGRARRGFERLATSPQGELAARAREQLMLLGAP